MESLERLKALEALAADVSTADLNRVLSTFPYLISEAVRDLNGEEFDKES